MLKAILFDMDDTLVDWSGKTQAWADYEREHLNKVYRYIREHVHPLNDFDDFLDTVWLLTTRAWTAARSHLKAPHLGNVLVNACLHLGIPEEKLSPEPLLDAYDWQPFPGVQAFADVLEVLPLFLNNGLKLGIVTNAYQPIAMRDRELTAFGLIDYFEDCRISAADVGYLKPHPIIFEHALNCLGITADETIFVGDSLEADVAGAQNAGIKAILRITPNYIPSQNANVILPDAEIKTFHDLTDVLDNWFADWR